MEISRYFFGALVAFLVSLIIAPFYIKFANKVKFGQNILKYVEEHKSKQGTPTMGGVIFVAGIVISTICFIHSDSTLTYVSLSATLAYAVLGFLDDFIKIKKKRNLGLTSKQKVIGQVLIAVLLSIFAYKSQFIGGEILIPFTTISFNIGWGIIPFVIFIFIATTNSVNLTDGLDGLAGGVSKIVLFAFGILILIYSAFLKNTGLALNIVFELNNLAFLCFISGGALTAFSIFNCYPAKIFMGDSGSMALGALIASIAIFSKNSLFILLFGIMFIASAVSVIIQVVYFKITKGKRVFLMAPLHHHFQHKGKHENQVVNIYIVITAVLCVLVLALQILIMG